MEKNFRCGHQAKKTHCQNSKRIHDKIHHKHRRCYGKRDSTFFHEIGACRLPSRGGWSDGRKKHISCREQKTLYRISFIKPSIAKMDMTTHFLSAESTISFRSWSERLSACDKTAEMLSTASRIAIKNQIIFFLSIDPNAPCADIFVQSLVCV